jgi:hypothetical protein
VGLVWAGSTVHKHDFLRTLPPEVLAPLAEVAGVDWYSLQVGYEGERPWEGLPELGPRLRDFGDTAQVLGALDLLVSVDTSIVHLAGALGRPAWVLLPLVPDWRWGLEGASSPWYPALRLFRQTRYGEWEDVVGRIAESLNALMGERRGTC